MSIPREEIDRQLLLAGNDEARSRRRQIHASEINFRAMAPTGGTLAFNSESIAGQAPEKLCRKGLAPVPEGRSIFRTLTVRENLLLGGMIRKDKAEAAADLGTGSGNLSDPQDPLPRRCRPPFRRRAAAACHRPRHLAAPVADDDR
ncbi:hypothetical protein [Mesorhizobium sp. WSM1293]|uniref:hypothetical protein n=1 Tax=Mesorhizobium sp. WSM1293 TaxID=1040984 RepID=UPI00048869B1|nr:hypothetical protein [Mesorhizobium sp. WSM1293]